MWGTWPWILLPIIWHGFQILFSTLQQKGRAMLTAPSPIPRFWQFFISWLCCTLIKCVFFPPEHCFQVLWHWPKHWSQCPTLRTTLSASIASGLCFLCPYLQPFTRGSLHSAQRLLPSPARPVLPLMSSRDLHSHSPKTFLTPCYRGDLRD